MRTAALFISDQNHLSSEISGGVQLCTREYIAYLSRCGYNIIEFGIHPSSALTTRIKIRAQLDVYERYRLKDHLDPLLRIIRSSDVKVIFFNQLSPAFWASELKKHVPGDVKFVALSHGNESGDHLHEVRRRSGPAFLQKWRLGEQLVKEAQLFDSVLDGLIVLNDDERAINRWLGRVRTFYLPRSLEPRFLDWKPEGLRAGFVGTLDHLPNIAGIRQLAGELRARGFASELRLVGAPVDIGNELQQEFNFIRYAGPLNDQELMEELRTWSVFLNPVFWYARGASTKLAMGIGLGLPCLTTPAGRRGYVLADETIVTANDTPGSMADRLMEVLYDPPSLMSLRSAAERNANEFDVMYWTGKLQEFLRS